MSGTQALMLVLESAEKVRDEAMAQFENARRNHDAARQQAQSLVDWRKDYQQRWQSQFQRSGGMEILRCYQDFMVRLGDAIQEQDKRVEQARLFMDRCRSHLIECERKVAAVGQLIERRIEEQQLKERRQEQKAMDEMASRAGRRASGLGSGNSSFASL